jgi:hypothetical protein
MSRGMPSAKALDAALTIARARGRVVIVQTWEGCDCDFLIDSPHGLSAVSVRRTRRIRASLAEIAEHYRETLNAIRAGGHCSGVACEFWLWSPYGSMRFFQLEGFGLVELTLLGIPLMPPVTAKFSGTPDSKRKSAGKVPGNISDCENISPEKFPGADRKIPGPAGSGPAPGQAGIREPAPVRYLRWRNAELRQRKEEGRVAGFPLNPGSSRDAPLAGGNPPAGGDDLPTSLNHLSGGGEFIGGDFSLRSVDSLYFLCLIRVFVCRCF